MTSAFQFKKELNDIEEESNNQTYELQEYYFHTICKILAEILEIMESYKR